jgi:hypothetical protein
MKSAIRNYLFRSHSNENEFLIQKEPCFIKGNPLPGLNEELDNLKQPLVINERTIERFTRILEDSGLCNQSSYWLLMARIFELAVFCAGHYADNCEFSAAGDLLANPRKVLIHRKGYPHSMVKPRHGCISDQFNTDERCRKHILLLLKRDIIVEISKPAILPYLFERMQHSQKIAAWYLQHAAKRMQKIADTISFLSAWPVSRFEDFHQRLQEASPKTRSFVGKHLCGFDTHYFKRLGQEIQKLLENSNGASKFLAYQ